VVNTFVDCPSCGSEFIVDEEIMSSNLRCPDCLQWVSSYSDDNDRLFVSAYAVRFDDHFEDYGYESGYDY
jgi:uncharacterized Zn finger protein